MSNDETTARRWKLVFIVLLGVATGVVGDLLAASILFRKYSFFESVVVCLLVMILCSVATIRVDFGPGGFLQRTDDTKENHLQQVSAGLKALFYGIAFIMALVKIVLTLIDSL
jgi:H+/Cl- antiporter ClcA